MSQAIRRLATRRHVVLTTVSAALGFAGLAAAVIVAAVGGANLTVAALVLLVGIALALLFVSPGLSFAYQCVAAPLLVTLNHHMGTWGPGRVSLYGLLATSLVVGGILAVRDRDFPRNLRPAAVVLVAFVLYLAGHVSGSETPGDALEGLVDHTYHWAFLMLPALLLRRPSQVRALVLFLVAVAGFLALMTVALLTLRGQLLSPLMQTGRYERVHLYFGTPNSLGVFLSMGFFLLLQAVAPRTRLQALAKYGTLALIVLAIVATYSRRAWLATAVVLLLHYVRHRDWRGAIVVLLLGAALAYQARGEVRQRAESILDPSASTNLDRKRELERGFRFLFGSGEIRWLGWGLDRATKTADVQRGRLRFYFHNYYLTLYYLVGAIGLLLYLALALVIARPLRRTRRRARAPNLAGLADAAMSVLAIFLITGVFGTLNVTFPVNYMAALTIGLVFAAQRMNRDQEDVSSPSIVA